MRGSEANMDTIRDHFSNEPQKGPNVLRTESPGVAAIFIPLEKTVNAEHF